MRELLELAQVTLLGGRRGQDVAMIGRNRKRRWSLGSEKRGRVRGLKKREEENGEEKEGGGEGGGDTFIERKRRSKRQLRQFRIEPAISRDGISSSAPLPSISSP